MTPEGRAEEMLLDYLLKAYKITPQSRTQVKTLVAAAIAQAVQEERLYMARAAVQFFTHEVDSLDTVEQAEWIDRIMALRTEAGR